MLHSMAGLKPSCKRHPDQMSDTPTSCSQLYLNDNSLALPNLAQCVLQVELQKQTDLQHERRSRAAKQLAQHVKATKQGHVSAFLGADIRLAVLKETNQKVLQASSQPVILYQRSLKCHPCWAWSFVTIPA